MLKDCHMPIKMIPRDVPTRWNLTCNMANVVVDYCVPIEDITNKWRLGLTAYTLNNHEWELLGQLRDVLKCNGSVFFSYLICD